MKACSRVEVELHAFLTSALYGGEWSASRTGRFTPRESTPDTRWIGGWVGPRNSQTLPGLEPPDHPARSPALYRLTTIT
jgi:hypothetical protein